MTDQHQPAFDKSGNTGFTHLINATRFSIKGLVHAFRNESAFRQELALSAILIPLAFYLGSTLLESVILIVFVLLVLLVELINSAIEAVVDRIGSDHHHLSGQAKDLGSAAVMISLLMAAMVWTAYLIQHFFP